MISFNGMIASLLHKGVDSNFVQLTGTQSKPHFEQPFIPFSAKSIKPRSFAVTQNTTVGPLFFNSQKFGGSIFHSDSGSKFAILHEVTYVYPILCMHQCKQAPISMVIVHIATCVVCLMDFLVM